MKTKSEDEVKLRNPFPYVNSSYNSIYLKVNFSGEI